MADEFEQTCGGKMPAWLDEDFERPDEVPMTEVDAMVLADIDDNSAGWRVEQLEPALQERLAQKYRRARQALGAASLDDASTGGWA